MIHFQRIFARHSKKEDIAHQRCTRHKVVKAHATFAVLICNQYLYQGCITDIVTAHLLKNSNMFSGPFSVVSSTNSMPITSTATTRTLHTPDNKATTSTGKYKIQGTIFALHFFNTRQFLYPLTLLISTLVTPLFEPSGNPIDCKWNEFGAWSSCSKTCGGGGKWRKRTRQIQTVKGGRPCKGDKLEFAECNNQKCAGKCTSPTFLATPSEDFIGMFFTLF